MNTKLPISSGASHLAGGPARSISSGVGSRPPRDETQVPTGTADDVEQLQNDAEKSADIAIAELKRCLQEYQGLTAHMESTLASLGLNKVELREKAKCSAASAASVRQSGRTGDPENEIRFAEEVLKAAANTRAERAIAAESRSVRSRSCRLADEIAILERTLRNATQLKISDSFKTKDWQSDAARFEEKAKVLRKQIDDLRVPSQSTLQKRYDEFVELKAKVSAEQKYLKQFDGLPPSLVEASEKLNAANRELIELRGKFRNNYQLNF